MGALSHAHRLYERFEVLQARIAPGRSVPITGALHADTPSRSFMELEPVPTQKGHWGGRAVFGLRVRGSALAKEGIHPGDYLLLEARADIDDGQLVVAEVDGQATLRRFFHDRDGRVRLQPATRSELPLIVRTERLAVRGVLVGVVRKHGFEQVTQPKAQVTPPSAASGKADQLRALGQRLRALRATYAGTEGQHLRRVLLREVRRVSLQMQRMRRDGLTIGSGSQPLRPARN